MRQRAGWLQGLPEAVLGGVEGDLPLSPGLFRASKSQQPAAAGGAGAIRPAVDTAIARVGRDRVAVVLGTSTSGLDEGDEYVRRAQNGERSPQWQYPQQELGDPSRFLASWLALDGPAYTISTACSSSARAIISGRRLIDAGLVDVAIVGGADSLSRMPVNGFNSRVLLPDPVRTVWPQPSGITIGEAAALMVLTREPGEVAPGAGNPAMRTIFPPHIRRAKGDPRHQPGAERGGHNGGGRRLYQPARHRHAAERSH